MCLTLLYTLSCLPPLVLCPSSLYSQLPFLSGNRVPKLLRIVAHTTPQQDSTVHEEDDGSDEEGDQPELFSVVDLDEENDIRTGLYSRSSVRKVIRTLGRQGADGSCMTREHKRVQVLYSLSAPFFVATHVDGT